MIMILLEIHECVYLLPKEHFILEIETFPCFVKEKNQK